MRADLRQATAFGPLEGAPVCSATRQPDFVSGMQDLILTNLSKIRDLKVISRSLMEKYARHPENLKVVGDELGVAHLLEGSVQQVGKALLRASVSDIARYVDAHPDIANRDLWFVQAAHNLAVVGDEADALAWLARAVELPSTAKSSLQSGWALEQSIRACALLDRVDLLLPALARMRESTGAGWVSAFEMSKGPWYAKVRDDPRVQAEIALFAELER